jgi:hypothetical protein
MTANIKGIVMFSFFNPSESEEEDQQSFNEEQQSSSEEEQQPKSLADYYDDLAEILADIREKIPHADKDPGFKQAAHVLDKVIALCHDIESSYNIVAVKQANDKRSRLLKKIGSDGIIDVTGEASRLLAIRYRELTIATAEKKYWPNPPRVAAFVVNSMYASELEKRAEATSERIQKYQDRITAYEKSQKLQRPAP